MEKQFCGQCGNRHQPKDKFCRYCGCSLDNSDTGKPPAEHDPDFGKSEALLYAEQCQREAQKEAMERQKLERERAIKCPECGNRSLPEKGYCHICGSLLKRYNSISSLLDDPFVPEYDSAEDAIRYRDAVGKELGRLSAHQNKP